MKLPDVLRKIKRNLWLAFPIYSLLLGFGSLNVQRYQTKYEQGYRNRKADAEFAGEFVGGILYLKNKYENRILFNSKTDNTVTLDVFVADNVKHFYDDAENPEDNNEWVGYVEKCLYGINKFSEFEDLNFKINNLEGILESKFVKTKNGNQFLSELSLNLKQKRKADVLLYLRSGAMMVGYTSAGGVTFPDSLVAIVNLTKHNERNQMVTAHELGHIFNAGHTSERIWLLKQFFVSIPSFGYIYWGDIMEAGIHSLKPQKYWADHSKKEIEANKYKFRK